MYQVQVHVEQRRPARHLAHHVGIPNLLEQCSGRHSCPGPREPQMNTDENGSLRCPNQFPYSWPPTAQLVLNRTPTRSCILAVDPISIKTIRVHPCSSV